MRSGWMLIAALALAACTAVPQAEGPRPTTYTVCLDQRGASRPVVCRSVPLNRLSSEPGFCLCADTLDTPVQAPICPRGVRSPGESRAYERARLEAARDGSLVGDSFEGRPMCVEDRRLRRTIY